LSEFEVGFLPIEKVKAMRVKVETQYYPRLTEWHLRKVLAWMNPLDLAGVEFIHLLPEETESKSLKQPAYLRSPVRVGKYFWPNPKMKNAEPPHISIYTRPLYYGIPSLLKYTPVATLRMAFVLAHEVGHHLIARRGYIIEPTEKYKPPGIRDERREGAANRYAVDLVRSISGRWYYRVGHWLSNKVSQLYYEFGVAAWEKSEYKRAAYYWFCSYCANPEDNEAAGGYQQAVARINLSIAKSNNGMHSTPHHDASNET
jgi:hypothetical protein